MYLSYKLTSAFSFRLFATGVLLAATGCATPPPEVIRDPYAVRPFSAPLGQALRVETGNALFVSGTYVEGEQIVLTRPVDMMLPGSMFIPFPVRIEAGALTLRHIGAHKYYCAAEGRATATFPGLGSVISSGDCVGVRVPTRGGEPEWVVDNSKHNRSQTIWPKTMSPDERAQIQVRPSPEPFKVRDMTRIVFDGYHGKELHFKLIESRGQQQESRAFTFDFNGEATVVGVRGHQWKVLSAGNLDMRYEWVRIAAD